MRVYMSSKNFNKKRPKGKIVSTREIFLKYPPKEYDPLYDEVKEFIKDKEYISMSGLQAHFSIGFPRAYKIMKQLKRDLYVFEETKYRVAPSEYFITYTDDDLK